MLWGLVCCLVPAGCSHPHRFESGLDDGDTEGDGGPDGDGDTDADSETDTDADADTDNGVPCADGNGWLDEDSGLCWQDPPIFELKYDEAIGYCDVLEIAGLDDWRLPTVEELRTLVRGCPGSEPGGTCPVDNETTVMEYDGYAGLCSGCEDFLGPGQAGCYWDPALGGECKEYLTSTRLGDQEYAFSIDFIDGFIGAEVFLYVHGVRCVRTGTE
jgi:hypothetical protein